MTYNYNNLGNITSKTSSQSGDTDVTGYNYHSTRKHAVSSATVDGTSQTLTYDSNGAITKYDEAGTNIDRYIQYNAANQPIKIVKGTGLSDSSPEVKDEFAYDPDGQRYARKTTWTLSNRTYIEHASYIGDVEYITYTGHPSLESVYKTRVGNNIIHLNTLSLNPEYDDLKGYPFNEQYLTAKSTEYAHRDHLGSVESVTDQHGNRLMQLAFEPFGQRKDSDWTKNIDTTDMNNILTTNVQLQLYSGADPIPNTHRIRVARGFTGHEHLDSNGFIHMNGRMYDPVLGRFLSPDPIVQAPTNSQSWNRYTYVFNNPMAFTDPSGFEGEEGIEEIVVTATRIETPQEPEKTLQDIWDTEAECRRAGLLYDYAEDRCVEDIRDLFPNLFGGGGFVNNDMMTPEPEEAEHEDCGQEEWKGVPYRLPNSWGQANFYYGLASTAISLNRSTFRLANSRGFSPKLYISGWSGGSRGRITTYSVSNLGKAAGQFGLGVGLVTDAVGVSNGTVSPEKAATNAGFAAYGYFVNPYAGIGYAAVDIFYPGGWDAAINDRLGIISENRELGTTLRCNGWGE